MSRDTLSPIAIEKCNANAVKTADENGSSIDRSLWETVGFQIHVGESGDTLSGSVYIDLVLQESDDDSAWSDVSGDDMVVPASTVHAGYQSTISNGIFAVIDAAADDDAIFRVQYRGTKRYVRVQVDVTGTHTNGTPIAISAIKTNPRYQGQAPLAPADI